MALFANNYSFILIAFILILAIWFCVGRIARPKWAIGSIAIIAVVLGTFQILTSTNASQIQSIEEFDAVLASGSPILLELYSNF